MTDEELKFRRAEFQSFSDKAIEASASAIKGALLMNGGAAVAVLGFVSSLWARGALPPGITDALMFFAWGVVISVLSSSFSYLTHLATMLQIEAIISGKRERLANIFKVAVHLISMLVFLAAIGAFVLGSNAVKDSIDSVV
ncbi:hypothetical protein [Leisingera caerulea]|uniref:hypothetical protein n=1 Tax=Leisingera caerulea TaxID=506591 RepID=UPI00047FE353|nr:hypothetical protein [Leisingera caerulea]